MFEHHLFNSTQRRFRESTTGVGDIQLQWLLISLRVSLEEYEPRGTALMTGGTLARSITLDLPRCEFGY
jgi:hypothetical protein